MGLPYLRSRPCQPLIGEYPWLVAEGPISLAASLLGAGPRCRSCSHHPPPPHLELSTWGRGRGRLGVGVWVPSRRRGWGGCGCWPWPSPAAGGHQAARVRRCGAASVAPQPETLRARASATSSSTVGSGPGRGIKARGPIPRALLSPPPLGRLELAAARLGTVASLPELPLSPVVSPTAASRNRGMRL